jgi:hypothetical protein
MDRWDAAYIALAYGGSSGDVGTQADIDALTVLYRALATELVANMPANSGQLNLALLHLEDSAKAQFYGMTHPDTGESEESVD